MLGRTVIHSVANPLRQFASAIHIYGGDLLSAPLRGWRRDTGEEYPYAVEQSRRVMAEANARWEAECARERAVAAQPPRT